MPTNFIDFILNLNIYLGRFVNEYGLFTYAILFLVIFCGHEGF